MWKGSWEKKKKKKKSNILVHDKNLLGLYSGVLGQSSGLELTTTLKIIWQVYEIK